MYKTLHKKQGSVTVQLRFARSSVTFCAKRDNTNYESLCKALEEKNYEQAFTHIHNLKGLAMNLGLTPLLVPAQELCEELRDGEPERDFKPLLDEVAAAYQKVLGIVEKLD